MSTKYWLWLVPDEGDANASALTSIIASYGGPTFPPHVQLATIESDMPLEEAVHKARTFAVTQGPLRLSFSGPATGDSYFKAAFLEVEDKSVPSLAELNRQVLEHFGQTVSPNHEYKPHASLFYGNEKERVGVKSKLFADPKVNDMKELHVTSLQLVIGSDSVEKWVFIGRSLLGTQRFFRDSLFIDGHFVSSASSKRIPVVNPANKRVIHSVPAGNAADVDRAVKAAHKAFATWRNTTVTERAKLLRALADEIMSRQKELTELEVLDNGKPWAEAEMDVSDTADCYRYYADLIEERAKEQDRAIDVGNPSFECHVRREPVGVCGLVIPWNYPLLMAAWKVAPCLAAGCTCVLKPSELTSLSALELAAMTQKVGFPDGVFNVVTGYGPEAGSPLVAHELVHKVAFTGSVPTGAKVATQAAQDVKKCSLELGGKSPIIVFPDADVDQVIDWISVGIFFNAGQVCSATSRLIVHKDIKDQVLTKLAELAQKIKMGPGLDTSSKLGPVVSEGQYKKIVSYIKSGLEQGAKALTGGVPEESEGFFVKPTIFVDVTPQMKIWQEEIFGPVLSVTTFSDMDEALKLANDSQYGLAAAVMSRDKETCKKVVENLEAGIVWVNCSQPTFVQAPWGGYKRSGIGRELGPWGLENYLETKQVSSWIDKEEVGWGWFTK